MVQKVPSSTERGVLASPLRALSATILYKKSRDLIISNRKMSAVCMKCGELIPKTTDHCYKCGLAKGTIVARADMKSELEETTAAVKSVVESTPDNQRDKVIGKQNWGEFETHSQRTTGKSKEESMAEIDRFIAQGQTEDGRKIERSDIPGAGTKLGNDINSMLKKNGIKAGISTYAVEGGVSSQPSLAKSKTVTTVTETRYEMEGEKKDGLIAHNKTDFKPTGPGSADDFLNQYKAKEAAYYKPGAANRNPNGVN